MDPDPHTEAEPSPAHRSPSRRVRRILAVGVGVAMVPALYAVASATTGGGGSNVDSRPSATVAARAGADDLGTELETEHGVVVEKPDGGAPTPSVPEATTPTVPAVTTPTTPEVEHPVPEPGDDNGVDLPDHDVGDDNGNDGSAAPAPAVPAGDQSFSSVGGSITVTVANGALSLASSTPAAGFGAEVDDNGPSRVEVRFTDGQTEWRIRVELAGGGLTSEVTQRG
jgi:hypothetical protein